VIPFELGRRAAGLLKGGGLDVTFLESGAGHWIPQEVVARAETFVARAIPKDENARA
jgi:hypothetical protein